MSQGRFRRLVAIGLGSAIVPLDSAVNIAFPAITRAFDGTLPEIQWLVIAYVLTYTCLLLVVGRIGDLAGHGAIFRFGLVWSAAALLLCALAPSYPLLIAARVAQGIGSALVLACGPALITGLYEERARTHAVGLYTMMVALGVAAGPLVGGVLVARWGWPAVFWFRTPIALAALALLPQLPAQARDAAMRRDFDIAGAALLALALAALLLALDRVGALAEGELTAPLLALAAAAALVAFVRRERRIDAPIIALEAFRAPGFAAITLGSVLVNLAGFAVLLLVPYFLVRILHLGDALAGAVLALWAVGTVAGAPAGAWLARRLGAAPTAAAGALLGAIGLALVAAAGPETGLVALTASLALQGFGLGLYQTATMDLVTGTLAVEARGVAGSLAILTRTLGIVMSASLLSLAYGGFEAAARARGADATAGFLAAFRATFWLAAALPAAVLAYDLLRRMRRA